MSQVGDYNIANASGASVRADINAVLDAIKTLNSGGSDPSNTEAFMPYVDTADSNNLKIRNASNNGFTTIGSINETNLGLLLKSGGTMTGNILGHDGSGSSSPSYAFDQDSDTGMYRAGVNTLGFSTGGVERVVIGSTGFTLSDQKEIRLNELVSNGYNYVALKSPSSLSGNITFTLPSTIVNGGFLQTDGSGTLSFATPDSVPTGCVFCRAVASVPAGYLECNGAAISRTTYSALFAVIGTQYGSGNGSSTFNLPDLRGEFVRGFDNGRGVDSGRSINNPQGSQNVSHNHSYGNNGITVSGANHAHNIRKLELNNNNGSVDITLGSGQSYNVGYSASDSGLVSAGNAVKNSGNLSMSGTVGITINNAGGNESRPRNVAMMYIIRI